MNVTVLSSGSKGNSVFFEHEGAKILIDAGISAKQIEKGLLSLNSSIDDLNAIFITHEHSDHIAGLETLSKNTGRHRQARCPIFISEESLNTLTKISSIDADFRTIKSGENISCGKICVTPFLLPHDAAMTFGYRVENKSNCVGYAADLGCITPLVEEGLRDSTILMVEFNHDVDMLMNSGYPVDIKMRVRGPRGHLSNEQGGELIERVISKKTNTIFLLHLSENNNFPSYALKACESVLSRICLKKKVVVTEQRKQSQTVKTEE